MRVNPGVTGGAANVFGKNFCPRAFAPMAGCRRVDLSINGKGTQSNPSEHIDIFTRFHLDNEKRKQFMSLCPSMPDNGELSENLAYNVYALAGTTTATAATGVGNVYDTAGGANLADRTVVLPALATTSNISVPNVNSVFADDTVNEFSRACKSYYVEQVQAVGTPGVNVTTRVYTFYCPVWCSPLSFDDPTSCINFETVNLRLDWHTFSGTNPELLNLMFNVGEPRGTRGLNAQSTNVPDWTISFVENPQLLLQYNDSIVEIPKQLAYHHLDVFTDVRQITLALGNGAATTFTIQSAPLNPDVIANEILICVRPRFSLMTSAMANVYAGITNLKVRWFGTDYTFGSNEIPLLHRSSVNNGLNITYGAFIHNTLAQSIKTGSVLSLKPGKDLPLVGKQYPGSPIKHTLQVTVTGNNLYYFNAFYDLYTILLTGSEFVIKGSNDVDITIGLTPDAQTALENAPISDSVQLDEDHGEEAHGGALNWKNITKVGRKIGSLAKVVYANRDGIKDAYNTAQDMVSQARNQLEPTAPSGGIIVGGGMQSRY